MTLCLYHSDCESHDPGPGHSESPERLKAVHRALKALQDPRITLKEMPFGTTEIFRLAHDPAYVDFVFCAIPEQGYREIEVNEVVSDHDDGEVTTLSPASRHALLRCAGGIKAAIDFVMQNEDRRAFCATRPPGHHALYDKAMGFCVFNNVATAARYAQKSYGVSKIAIVDFDVHHGNGTQELFANDPSVFHASVHQLPLWPETGFAHEVGGGNLLNVPLEPYTPRHEWIRAWKEIILPRLDEERPNLILISAGFDAHKDEPKAQQNLETEDYATLTKDLVALAQKHAKGRIASFLEGGYNPTALAQSAAQHVLALG